MFSPALKLAGIILVFGVLVATAQAQQTCTLKPEQLPAAPELYGFRLGITTEQAKARTPLIRLGRTDEFGVSKTSISPSYDPRFDQTVFFGARTISFDFLDDRLVSLWIGYDDRFKWQTVDDFVAGITKSLNLGSEFTPKRAGKELNCQGFSIYVSTIARSPSMRITDVTAEETIAARREAAAEAGEPVLGDKSMLVYYLSTCEPTAIAAADRITFKNKSEAEKAGYKLAKDCQ
jgi:hypothetical protein